MKEANGVKVFNVGEMDCFYAPTKEDAIVEANNMFGDGFVGDDGDVTLDEVVEYTDEEFGRIGIVQFGDDGNPLKDGDKGFVEVSCEDHLKMLMKDGSKSGHFSTSEW